MHTYNSSGDTFKIADWGDGIGDDGSGNYPLARQSTSGSTCNHYTDKVTHSHKHNVTTTSTAKDVSAGDNVPEYLGLLKLIRIY